MRDTLDRVRQGLLAAARRHGLEVAGPALDARRSLAATLIAASIGVEDMRPRRLRGYGALAEGTAREIERTCDDAPFEPAARRQLEADLAELRAFRAGGGGGAT